MSYRVLSCDGGGVRGIYTAVLLQRLNAAVPTFFANVDLLAGTSTGGLIALALAMGQSPDQLVAFYQANIPGIFQQGLMREIRDLGDLVGAKYGNSTLTAVLTKLFGTRTLADLLPRHVLIPSFDLDNGAPPPGARMWNPKFFHNFAGPDSDGAQKIVDVALRTSAAPTYFPVYQGYVDGGVIANNPSMAVLAQAIDPGTGGQSLANLRLFSIGTGITPTFISGDAHNWGVAQWAHPLINMMIEGGMGVADYECARLLGTSYFRLAPVLPSPIPLDSADRVNDLIGYANAVDISDAIIWLRTNS
jgi:hypothetical protein